MFPSVSFLAFVLCHLSKSTYAQKELPSLNRVVGSTVALQPASVDSGISGVTWKHNNDLAAEWFGRGKPDYYREFKNHASLNEQNGVLTIGSLTAALSGTYTVEINNKVISSQKLQVFDPVPKPTISVIKITDTSYVLTCNSHVNDAAQLVQVKWIIDNEETSEKYNELTINEGTVSRSFVCMSTNPVSNMSSDAVTNPFLTGPDNPGLIGKVVAGVVILVLAVLVILGLLVLVVRPPHETEEKNEGNKIEEDKLMDNKQLTEVSAQQQQPNVGTDDSANNPAAQVNSNHISKEKSAPEKDQN